MLVEHMKREFADRCRRNPAYSLRAFARSLGMDSSTVSAILKGKRPVTVKTARRILDGLHITDPGEAQALLLETVAGSSGGADSGYTELDLDVAEAISSWEHFAILALMELKDFSGQERAIAERLNIPLGIVLECLGRLSKLGLVANRHARWALTGKNMATPTGAHSAALREGHKQAIFRALRSLDQDSVGVRDVSGITMAISRERLGEARKMIQEFRRRLSSYLEGGRRNSVYRLNIQLFPLTQEKDT